MIKTILLATNNQGKIDRFRKLIAYANPMVEVKTVSEQGIEEIEVIEDEKTLLGNARRKALAYIRKTDLPVLANDTGFWTENDGFIDAPKRLALGGKDEKDLTKEEIVEHLLKFWKQKAIDNGGRLNCAWVESFVLIWPDGTEKQIESRRDVILTDTEFGAPPLQMPIRALYISKSTNKAAINHTEEEEILEMQPIIKALEKLLS